MRHYSSSSSGSGRTSQRGSLASEHGNRLTLGKGTMVSHSGNSKSIKSINSLNSSPIIIHRGRFNLRTQSDIDGKLRDIIFVFDKCNRVNYYLLNSIFIRFKNTVEFEKLKMLIFV